jgi:Asp-tRNA(Asn)/Glu-tRNA(Gln) amidotransferase A subunit family amidase
MKKTHSIISFVSQVLQYHACMFSVQGKPDMYGTDEPEKYRNAPVSLQFVGRRYEDEKVIEAVEYLQSKAGFPFVTFV